MSASITRTKLSIRIHPSFKISTLRTTLVRAVPDRAADERSKSLTSIDVITGDGKEIAFDTEKLKIIDVMEEVDRHSRGLQRKADLTGN